MLLERAIDTVHGSCILKHMRYTPSISLLKQAKAMFWFMFLFLILFRKDRAAVNTSI